MQLVLLNHLNVCKYIAAAYAVQLLTLELCSLRTVIGLCIWLGHFFGEIRALWPCRCRWNHWYKKYYCSDLATGLLALSECWLERHANNAKVTFETCMGQFFSPFRTKIVNINRLHVIGHPYFESSFFVFSLNRKRPPNQRQYFTPFWDKIVSINMPSCRQSLLLWKFFFLI